MRVISASGPFLLGCLIAPVILFMSLLCAIVWSGDHDTMVFIIPGVPISINLGCRIAGYMFLDFEGTVVRFTRAGWRPDQRENVVIRETDGKLCEISDFPYFKFRRLSVGSYIKKRRFGRIVIQDYLSTKN